jgi:hypothetical protein
MPSPQTANQRLASMLLKTDAVAWAVERRAAGKPWQTIADELNAATAGAVNLSRESMRLWVEASLASQDPAA